MKITCEKIVVVSIYVKHLIGVDQPPVARISFKANGWPMSCDVPYHSNKDLIEKLNSMSPFEPTLTKLEFNL